jgi:hypothetical protein
MKYNKIKAHRIKRNKVEYQICKSKCNIIDDFCSCRRSVGVITLKLVFSAESVEGERPRKSVHLAAWILTQERMDKGLGECRKESVVGHSEGRNR